MYNTRIEFLEYIAGLMDKSNGEQVDNDDDMSDVEESSCSSEAEN